MSTIMPIFHSRRRNSYEPSSRDAWEPLHEYNHHHETAIASPHPRPNPHPYPQALSPPPHHHRQVFSPPPPHHHHANESLANSRIEWREVADAYFIRTELPGIRREDVKVVVEDDKLLKITGMKNMEYEDTYDNWQHFQRSAGKFMTAFMLPEDARADQVRITMENGVLTITVPKKQMKHYVRPVEIVV